MRTVTASVGAALTAMATAIVIYACSDAIAPRAKSVGELTGVTSRDMVISPDTATLPVGDTLQLYLTIKGHHEPDNDEDDENIQWTSLDPANASVGENGLVRAVAPGLARIVAQFDTAADTARVNVVADTTQLARVVTVSLSPSPDTAVIGSRAQFTAIPRDSAGTALTGRKATWSSSNPSIATVDTSGLATAVSSGVDTIRAVIDQVTGTATMVVTAIAPPPVASVTVTPNPDTIQVGKTSQLTATTKDSAGNTLTGRKVTWASSDSTIAKVDTTGKVTGVKAGNATVTATSEGKSGTSSIVVVTPPPAPVASVTVSPSSGSIQAGKTLQLTATEKDSAGNTLTGRTVTWTTSNAGVATVSSAGLVTGVAAGSATITATSEGKSGTSAITVTAASPAPVATVSVTPSSASITAGTTVQLTATERDSSGNILTGRTVTWTSSNTSVATVSSTGLVNGVAAGSATITATSETKSGTSAITVTPPSSTNVLVGAGDIADCSLTSDDSTANLLATIAGTVFTAGDNAYPNGATSDFANCYDPTWGRQKARTRPSPGNHDYNTSGAAPYYAYFGANAGPAGQGYYSYDMAGWHIISLNSAISVSSTDAQLTWLKNDLAASTAPCKIAYWHHPRFSSGTTHGSQSFVQPFWDALYAAHADVVVAGHEHNYERFSPQSPTGVSDPNGIVEFVAGIGGQSLYSFGTPIANSVFRDNKHHGLLKFTLGNGSYSWQYLALDGTVLDSGTGTCHGVSSTSQAPVASVSVTLGSSSLQAGQTTQATSTERDSAGNVLTGRSVAWSSSNTSVATVNSTGLVTAVAAGSANIVATSEGKSGSAPLTVTAASPAPVASVTVTPSSASIQQGSTVQLTATEKDSAGNTLSGRTVTWASSNTSVATVSSTGLVTGVAVGSATITATSETKSGTSAITVTTVAAHAGWYASPSGTSSGTGSSASPWDLTTAITGGGGKVQPGDTIWLRGGTYHGIFHPSVSGVAGNPVIVRQYPGERAIIDGAGTTSDIWHVTGSWAVYWGFELMDSDLSRTIVRPNMVANYADHTKYIDLVVHDGGFGFYTSPTNVDVEIVGCLVYNNGMDLSSKPDGHGMYLKNNTGPVLARDNILFQQFGYGVHEYSNSGSGGLTGITVQGNVSFNNGTVSSFNTQHAANILIGGQEPVSNAVVKDNMLYYSDGSGLLNMILGYQSLQNNDVAFTSNYVVGGAAAFTVRQWTNPTVSGNTIVGPTGVVSLEDTSRTGYTWGTNTYYRDPTASAWTYNGTASSFAGWQTSTGLGATDNATATMPTAQKIFVEPNPYEKGRANVVVYNWPNAGSASVDLSGVLTSGDQYEILNAQDYFGTPVVTGTYSGGTVTVPLTASAPAPMIGGFPHTPPSTGTFFNVFVVRRTGP